MKLFNRTLLVCLVALLGSGCSASFIPSLSLGHLKPTANSSHDDIPPLATGVPDLPEPQDVKRQEVYTVVVNAVPVKELLFSLARDAKLNVDIAPGVDGVVTLNAIKQTVPQILDRINKQLPMRYKLNGNTLLIENDNPFWRTYTVGYLNMDRESSSQVGVATEISTAGGSVKSGGSGGGSGGGGSGGGNLSHTNVKNTSNNQFWTVLEKNINSLIGQADTLSGAPAPVVAPTSGAASANSAGSSVVVNAVGGVISVYANEKQQRQVQEYIEQVLNNVLRQVLIEMTIVEVELNDHYQAGVDWKTLSNGVGISLLSSMTGNNLSTAPVFSINFNREDKAGRTYDMTLKMLETFGNVKVLSSPKIIALNNQTALLKVVDENVYFTVEMEIEKATTTTPEQRTYTSTVHTVPVGLVMSVMPQISDNNNITLSIRPTISRITGYVADPMPRLANANFDNLIPSIQVREMESLLQVRNEQMVVMGGLMQNKQDKKNQGVPMLSKLPWVGKMFKYDDESYTKSELVLFLKPTILKMANMSADSARYKDYMSFDQDQTGAGK